MAAPLSLGNIAKMPEHFFAVSCTSAGRIYKHLLNFSHFSGMMQQLLDVHTCEPDNPGIEFCDNIENTGFLKKKKKDRIKILSYRVLSFQLADNPENRVCITGIAIPYCHAAFHLFQFLYLILVYQPCLCKAPYKTT